MTRATFPDAPLTAQEIRNSLRFGGVTVPKRCYLFQEVREIERTLTYTVVAHDEAEARELMAEGRYTACQEEDDEQYYIGEPELIGVRPLSQPAVKP